MIPLANVVVCSSLVPAALVESAVVELHPSGMRLRKRGDWAEFLPPPPRPLPASLSVVVPPPTAPATAAAVAAPVPGMGS